MQRVTLNVNGSVHDLEVPPGKPLLFVLRNDLGLTGAKLGCGQEQCGACVVLADGAPVYSCVRAASEFRDAEIRTIEGLAVGAALSPVQQAFLEERAAQCGFCTAGMIMAATALLAKNPSPSTDDICAALDGHLCRCGTHARVLAAVEKAAKRSR